MEQVLQNRVDSCSHSFKKLENDCSFRDERGTGKFQNLKICDCLTFGNPPCFSFLKTPIYSDIIKRHKRKIHCFIQNNENQTDWEYISDF